MAITEQRRGNSTHLSYVYRNDSKLVCIYCGKKGLASTKRKIRAARRKHYEAKLRKVQDMLE